MPAHTSSAQPARSQDSPPASGGRDGAGGVRRRFIGLSVLAAVYTYALIVFGGLVRITGSGMGCGDDWPRCNGQWIPAFDAATLLEYGHRLLAAGLIVPIAAVAIVALRNRGRPGFGGPGGLTRPTAAVVLLLGIQVVLGAVTVKLELPASTTVLHFVAASLILALLIVGALRAARAGSADSVDTMGSAGAVGADGADSAVAAAGAVGAARTNARPRAALAAAGLGLAAVLFGALTANTGAAPLCQGFPLCNGEWLPGGGAYVQIHWTHRVIAFLLFFHVLGATISLRRRGAPRPVRRAAEASLGLVTLQLAVAAVLVLLQLPAWLQALHLAVGMAAWCALVIWAALARRAAAGSAGGSFA